jgi:hypothetical protein
LEANRDFINAIHGQSARKSLRSQCPRDYDVPPTKTYPGISYNTFMATKLN